MSKILIVTSSFDKTVDYITSRFSDLDFIRINVDQLDSYNISITNQDHFKISIKNSFFEIEDLFTAISSIYYRKLFLPDLIAYDPKYHTYMQKEIYSLITGLVDSFDGKVLSRPSTLRKVENKIFQLKIASDLGFLLPDSLISNDSESANSFLPSEKIAKPLASGKLTENTAAHSSIVTNHIDNITLSPTYFQEFISKDYELRVTVIDDTFYTVKIEAFNQIDWRENEDQNNYALIDTPEIVKKQCRSFLKACNISFGAFDYIVSNGEYYFLECNPNGQWLWLEMKLGLDISDSIIGYLNG
jgi:hypothetical protein